MGSYHDLSEVERVLLFSAAEDWKGLWEAIGELRALDPTALEPALIITARETLTELYELGLIDFSLGGRWTEDFPEPRPVSADYVSSLLQDPESWSWSWSAVIEDDCLYFFSTPEGEAVLMIDPQSS